MDPDRKVIEKAFRRNALKCHPDKGGDPVAFKKLNDAYYKLIGHITKVLTLVLLSRAARRAVRLKKIESKKCAYGVCPNISNKGRVKK